MAEHNRDKTKHRMSFICRSFHKNSFCFRLPVNDEYLHNYKQFHGVDMLIALG